MSRADELRELGQNMAKRQEEERQLDAANAALDEKRRAYKQQIDERVRRDAEALEIAMAAAREANRARDNEPPPPEPIVQVVDPFATAPEWKKSLIHSVCDIADTDQADLASGRADTIELATRDGRLDAAVKTAQRLGVLPLGNFVSGPIAIRGVRSGLTHVVRSVGELSYRTMLLVGGHDAASHLESEELLKADDLRALQKRTKQEADLRDIVMLAGLRRLAGDPAEFVRQIEADDAAFRKARIEGKVAEAAEQAAAKEPIGADSEEEDTDGGIDAKLIGQ